MTTVVDAESGVADPVVGDLLPSRPCSTTMSTDAPGQGDTRPFGLTRCHALADDEAMMSLDGARYDPARQLNVDSAGRPFAEDPSAPQMGTSYDTRYDMVWVVDKD